MDDKEYHEMLHRNFDEREEAYHAAYPNVRAPYTEAILLALLGRNRVGFILWGVVGLCVGGLMWYIIARLWY